MSWIFNLVAHLFADLPKRMYGLASACFEQLVYHDVLSSDIVSSLPSHGQLRGSSVFGGGRQKYVPAKRLHSQHNERRRVLKEVHREYLQFVFAENSVDIANRRQQEAAEVLGWPRAVNDGASMAT